MATHEKTESTRPGRHERSLSRLLETANGEREIHAYLKKREYLVLQAFNRAWNTHHVIPEFRVGADFRSDFVILSAHSGAWLATFIELKSQRVGLYKRDGLPTRALSVAKRQLAEWRNYVCRFEPVLRHQFSALLRKRRVPTQCSVAGKFASGADEILSPATALYFHYHIVIGRSCTLTEEERKYREQDMSWGGPAIATYDRFLALERERDSAERNRRRREGDGPLTER